MGNWLALVSFFLEEWTEHSSALSIAKWCGLLLTKLAQAVMILACILEMPGFELYWNACRS
jgi:hypothetical protein